LSRPSAYYYACWHTSKILEPRWPAVC